MASLNGWSPSEQTQFDDLSTTEKSRFIRDQRKTAILAAANIPDRDELCTVLEMLGFEIARSE